MATDPYAGLGTPVAQKSSPDPYKGLGRQVTAKAPPPRQKGTGIKFLDYALDTVNETALGAVEGLYNTGAFFSDPIAQLFVGKKKITAAKKQREEFFNNASRNFSTQELPLNRMLGATIAPAGTVSRAANLTAPLAKQIPKVGPTVTRVLKAVSSGGIGSGRTAAQTVKIGLPKRAVDLGLRSTGAGIGGGTTAALMGDDVKENVAVSALVPGGAAVGGKLAGKIIDMFRGDKLRAAELFREALGTDLEAARQVFANLLPDDQRLARKILIDAKIEPDTFMALGADVERLKPTQVRLNQEAENAARNAELNTAAGGANATENRAATEAARKNVSATMRPQANAALERANVAGRAIPKAEQLAAAIRQRADEITASRIVPKMRGLSERSAAQARLKGFNPEADIGGIQKTRGIAGASGKRADDAIDEQVKLRDRASALEDAASQLAAEGMTPLEVIDIVQEIRSMANAPGTRASTLQRNALADIADHLESLSTSNGVIDARDLYQVRKTELNDTISRLLSGQQPSSGVKETASALLGQIKPMIDDAIEAAGGVGWKDYLARSAEGYQNVARQELTGYAARLAQTDESKFLQLMDGQDPDTVESILGTGQFDINALSVDAPRYSALKNAETQFRNRNRMADLSQSGGVAANKLMATQTPKKLRAAARVALAATPVGRNVVQGAQQFSSEFMQPKVSAKLAEGFMSGKSANQLLNINPAALMTDEYLTRLTQNQRNALAQLLRTYITSPDQNAD
jgi:hypothetical protein